MGDRLKILITGGAGTVGRSFVDVFHPVYEFYCIGTSDIVDIDEVSFSYSKCDIIDKKAIVKLIADIQPDVVIHAAALKHVNIAEKHPTKAVAVNLLGSANLIEACKINNVAMTIGISTDKACRPEGIYGYTKKIMEEMFRENHTSKNKFVCVRLSNIAMSNGSVIPFWINLANENKPLKLTDSRMNRLMCSKIEVAELINAAINYCKNTDSSFVLTKVMKSVNMLELARAISKHFQGKEDIELVGLRPGEKLNETLISQRELPYAYLTDDKQHVMLFNSDFGKFRLSEELSSLTAEYMNKVDIQKLFLE